MKNPTYKDYYFSDSRDKTLRLIPAAEVEDFVRLQSSTRRLVPAASTDFWRLIQMGYRIVNPYMGFRKLTAELAKRPGVTDPKALAAWIGRRKYGKEKFQAMAAKGRARAKNPKHEVRLIVDLMNYQGKPRQDWEVKLTGYDPKKATEIAVGRLKYFNLSPGVIVNGYSIEVDGKPVLTQDNLNRRSGSEDTKSFVERKIREDKAEIYKRIHDAYYNSLRRNPAKKQGPDFIHTSRLTVAALVQTAKGSPHLVTKYMDYHGYSLDNAKHEIYLYLRSKYPLLRGYTIYVYGHEVYSRVIDPEMSETEVIEQIKSDLKSWWRTIATLAEAKRAQNPTTGTGIIGRLSSDYDMMPRDRLRKHSLIAELKLNRDGERYYRYKDYSGWERTSSTEPVRKDIPKWAAKHHAELENVTVYSYGKPFYLAAFAPGTHPIDVASMVQSALNNYWKPIMDQVYSGWRSVQ